MAGSSKPRTGRRTLLVTGVTTAVIAATLGVGATSSQAADTPAAPQSAGPPQAVIVLLKDQLPATPADAAHVGRRSTDAMRQQQAVLNRLAGPAPSNVKHYGVGNAFALRATAAQVKALAADPTVAAVVPDGRVSAAPASADDVPGSAPAPATARRNAQAPATVRPGAAASSAVTVPPGPAKVPAQACSTNPKKPLLEPEALQTLNVRSDDRKAKTAAALGFDGAGVKVAYIADGINPANAAFIRPNGKSAIIDYQDFSGDGTDAQTEGAEAFGDAAPWSPRVARGLRRGQFRHRPGSGHVPRRSLLHPHRRRRARRQRGRPQGGRRQQLTTSSILQAIDYAVRVAHVDIINESFGANPFPDAGSRQAIQVFDERAVAGRRDGHRFDR